MKYLLVILTSLILTGCIYIETKTHTRSDNGDSTSIFRELVIDKDIIKLIKNERRGEYNYGKRIN